MTNPFKIDGPAVISFSGGRTSGLMLRRILDAHGGALPADVHVLFANTGKEREETLDFVRDVGEHWGVDIVWLEYAGHGIYRTTDWRGAARRGEPFDMLIDERKFLPFPSARFCTADLKVRAFREYMRGHGHEHWLNVVGLRADEERRVANITRNSARERWESVCPLHTAGVTVSDVAAFWGAQPFDLALQSYEGNCDLCFLKGINKRRRIIEEHPELAEWWVSAETRIGARFRAHGLSYAELVDRVSRQGRLSLTVIDDDPTDIGDCGCTD